MCAFLARTGRCSKQRFFGGQKTDCCISRSCCFYDGLWRPAMAPLSFTILIFFLYYYQRYQSRLNTFWLTLYGSCPENTDGEIFAQRRNQRITRHVMAMQRNCCICRRSTILSMMLYSEYSTMFGVARTVDALSPDLPCSRSALPVFVRTSQRPMS